MKYNRAEIMKSAWNIREAEGVTMGAALKKSWGVAKLTVGVNRMDKTVQEYFRRLEAADKALEEIKAEIQAACLESPDFTLSGFGWNASFKEVTSNRFDSNEFKAAGYADLFQEKGCVYPAAKHLHIDISGSETV